MQYIRHDGRGWLAIIAAFILVVWFLGGDSRDVGMLLLLPAIPATGAMCVIYSALRAHALESARLRVKRREREVAHDEEAFVQRWQPREITGSIGEVASDTLREARSLLDSANTDFPGFSSALLHEGVYGLGQYWGSAWGAYFSGIDSSLDLQISGLDHSRHLREGEQHDLWRRRWTRKQEVAFLQQREKWAENFSRLLVAADGRMNLLLREWAERKVRMADEQLIELGAGPMTLCPPRGANVRGLGCLRYQVDVLNGQLSGARFGTPGGDAVLGRIEIIAEAIAALHKFVTHAHSARENSRLDDEESVD